MKKADKAAMAAFVEFSTEVCSEDHLRDPVKDSGHMCPAKFADGGKPENPWVLVALKLYAQQNGS